MDFPDVNDLSDDDEIISEKQKKTKRIVEMVNSQVTSTKCSIM